MGWLSKFLLCLLTQIETVITRRIKGFLSKGSALPIEHWRTARVRCNCVRHAILSAPDTFAYYAIVSGAMQKPSGGHVHDCMCARKQACMHLT